MKLGCVADRPGVARRADVEAGAKRRDALLDAAKVIQLVNEIGLKHAPVAVSTVGMINSVPNSRNVIPGRVFSTVDFRCLDNDELTSRLTANSAALAVISTRDRRQPTPGVGT